ncbi:hypothetical protein [Chryseobacterium sp.]|uniref:hypothetical protein n=1 Tax=Chryseobacterium sp. TaxID=1871047 RepID=UPI00283D8746|nr:hypothetical protein [Chryseobacterium sp.]MDR3026074.1 hypothetical protein [Chryseobacterium sp.]
MKLTSLSDYVLEQEKIILDEIEYSGSTSEDYRSMVQFITLVTNYTKFLKQPLTLGMFMPVDEDGVVLKEPKKEDYTLEELEASYMGIDVLDYHEAKEKVIFEGWIHEDRYGWVQHHKLGLEINTETGTLAIFHENGIGYGYVKKAEDLVSYGLELTPSAIEAIGLKE